MDGASVKLPRKPLPLLGARPHPLQSLPLLLRGVAVAMCLLTCARVALGRTAVAATFLRATPVPLTGPALANGSLGTCATKGDSRPGRAPAVTKAL